MQARIVVEKVDPESRKIRRTGFTIAAFSCMILTYAMLLILFVLGREIIPIHLPVDIILLTAALLGLVGLLCLLIAQVYSPIYTKNYGILELDNGRRIRLDELTNADLDGLVAKASYIKLERHRPGSD